MFEEEDSSSCAIIDSGGSMPTATSIFFGDDTDLSNNWLPGYKAVNFLKNSIFVEQEALCLSACP